MAMHEERQPGPDPCAGAATSPRPVGLSRFRRFSLILGVVLLLAFVAFLLYMRWYRNRFENDPALLAELENARLVEDTEGEALAGDWPQWRGPRRDGVSLETGLNWNWPEDGPKQLWEARAGQGFSTFAVAAGRAYTLLQDGNNEAVVCSDAETGKEYWRFRSEAFFRRGEGSGPRSTPTVDGDRVYTVGATGVFHCLNAATGEKMWRHDLLKEFGAKNLQWGVSFSPLIEGNLVLTNPGGGKGNSVVAFDKHSGQVVWHALDDPAGYSSPIAVTAANHRQAIFFTGSRVVGLAPADGRLLWQYPWSTSYDVNAATPIAFSARAGDTVNDYVFVSSGYGKGCALLKLTPAGSGVDVQRVYESARMRNHFASSVRLNEQLYGFDEDSLTCLDLLTGSVRWKKSGFRKGSLTIADGKLIILGENGQLAVANATPEGYREVASFQFSRSKCWTVPVVANGRLYLRDEERIACYDLRH